MQQCVGPAPLGSGKAAGHVAANMQQHQEANKQLQQVMLQQHKEAAAKTAAGGTTPYPVAKGLLPHHGRPRGCCWAIAGAAAAAIAAAARRASPRLCC